ncbi:MAG TPA: response regulator transcription factor [Gallionella sp.]|nr:response regulator transcription factor [Gallionella sp.]
MLKILIADDHSIVRKGLKHLCKSAGDMVVAGEAANGEEVLEALRHAHFDLLLLDLTMPGLGGVELVEKIRAQHASLPILIFSMRSEMQVAKRMAALGVGGYITKGGSDEMLLAAIRKVAAGGISVDPLIAEQMVFEQAKRRSSMPGNRLSQRELQILKLLGQGKSVNEIADELLLNSRTVSTYKARLMQKMNFKNNAELVLYASESGLI